MFRPVLGHHQGNRSREVNACENGGEKISERSRSGLDRFYCIRQVKTAYVTGTARASACMQWNNSLVNVTSVYFLNFITLDQLARLDDDMIRQVRVRTWLLATLLPWKTSDWPRRISIPFPFVSLSFSLSDVTVCKLLARLTAQSQSFLLAVSCDTLRQW